MTIGKELIAEQKIRGEYGMHFSYAGYQLLKEISTFRELNLVLRSWGMNHLSESMTAAELLDAIGAHLLEQDFNDGSVAGSLFGV